VRKDACAGDCCNGSCGYCCLLLLLLVWLAVFKLGLVALLFLQRPAEILTGGLDGSDKDGWALAVVVVVVVAVLGPAMERADKGTRALLLVVVLEL